MLEIRTENAASRSPLRFEAEAGCQFPSSREVLDGRTPGGGDPLFRELLETAGALRIALGAWLCRIDEDGSPGALIAWAGSVTPEEISEVLRNLNGLAMQPFSTRSGAGRAVARPFQWMTGEREYIVCAIGGKQAGPADPGGALLVLNTGKPGGSDWPAWNRVVAHIGELVRLGLRFAARGAGEPHCGTAWTTENETERDATMQALADLCPFGMMIVDADAVIRFANRALRTHLAGPSLIGCAGGELTISNSEDSVRLHVALRAVLGPQDGLKAPQTLALASDDARPILLSIAPLPGLSGLACIIVTDSAAPYHVHVEPLARAFALTPAEIRLVVQLVQGQSLQEAAQALKLKLETARTYLKQIFQKTGTHRQLELIKLMKGGALPSLR